ncbi:hypothetical protein GOV04_03435 [Candidatus Woesearchaeota archaeon]|nr:hypothetical protein [Candidatus Woesearchaeota archaeon]
MDFKKALEKIKASKSIKPKGYLAHYFASIDAQKKEHQLGYYNKTTDKLHVIDFVGRKTVDKGECDALKDGGIVDELKLSNVKITDEEALGEALSIADEKYGQKIIKKILVLQCLNNKTLYNITLIGAGFSIINIKLDAKTKSVISESKQSIMELADVLDGDKK